MKWTALGLAVAFHVTRLLFRARAWQNILRASYPGSRLRFRSAFGAYVAGVGVNSIAPARGGDLVKLYLVRHRVEEATYPTLASTLAVETLFDFVVGTTLMLWALTLGVLPTREAYSRIPTVDWKFFLRHSQATEIGLAIGVVAAVFLFFWVRRRARIFWEHVRLGFAILADRRRFLVGVVLPQAISWVFRVASLFFFLEAFRVHATIHNALLVLVVDSMSTLFPATPGGAGTKQGLIVVIFAKESISSSLLLAFSVGANIAVTVANLVLGLGAIGLMARTLSFKRLRSHARADQPVP